MRKNLPIFEELGDFMEQMLGSGIALCHNFAKVADLTCWRLPEVTILGTNWGAVPRQDRETIVAVQNRKCGTSFRITTGKKTAMKR